MKALAVSCLTALLAGCGYSFGGPAPYIAPTAHTISVPLFKNRTREHGLEVHVRRALEEEIRRRGALRIVGDDTGDLELSGEIRHFSNRPVATSGVTDEAVQYETVIQLSIRLTERASGQRLYENKLFQAASEYGAVRSVVVNSSPRFQRGTMNGRDLVNLTNVQLAESRRHASTDDLLDVLAHDIYQQVVEGF